MWTLTVAVVAFEAGWLLKGYYGSPGAIWRALAGLFKKSGT
jgi:hypothetical protein